jgi:integrase
LRGVLDATWQRSKYRQPNDLVFTNKKGGPVNRLNLLRRHLKPAVEKLGLPATVDFRSFRTMHSSLMSSVGVRPEVTRDNMGHSTVDVTQNVYNRTWWEERVEAVSLAAASVADHLRQRAAVQGKGRYLRAALFMMGEIYRR